MESGARTLVAAAVRDGGGGSFTNIEQSEPILASLGKHFKDALLTYTFPVVRLAYLPFIEKKLNDVLNQNSMNDWNSRCVGVSQNIDTVRKRLPKSFSPEMINTDKRFPIDRIGQTSDGKFYDKWLGEALGSKLIFFDSSKYLEELKRWYRDFYLPQLEKEQNASRKIEAVPTPAEVAPPPPVNDGPSPALMREFRAMSDFEEKPDSDLTLSGRIRSKIYGGGGRG
jgi:hypothetical protein